MLPGATDLMAGGDRWAQGCRLSCLLRLPALEDEQPLDVLTRGDQQGFYVYLLKCPQSEPPHPVPVFGLSKQRLDPYPPRVQSLLVEEGPAVAFHPIDVLLIEVA